MLPRPMLQCIGGGSQHSCTSNKSPYVYLHCHKPALSLFCRAALSTGGCFFAISSAAVHWCLLGALLNREQISRMHALLSGFTVQHILTAILCNCIYTYQDLLFTQVCNQQHKCIAALCTAKRKLVVQCYCAKQDDHQIRK